MLDTNTKKRIDDCRDILVGKLPDPKAQIEQITIGLIYKFMDDMDKEAIELGGKAKFFSNYKIPDPNDPKKSKEVNFEQYSWDSLFDTKVTAHEMLGLYTEAIMSMDKNPNIPQLFRDIFKNAFLPYRDPETLKLFLKTINEFKYTHSEKLGDAFEYLLSVMGSQGDAGQFRTPRHIIDFIVKAVDPGKTDTILDPACGTAGFLISAFKYIKEQNEKGLTPDERKKLINNFIGYDISPDMVRLSLVNLYLHGFSDPHIHEYDTLSSEERWNESYDVILANPPFMTPKGGIRPHKKFTIKSNRSEVLFVDYIAEHLNPNGKAGIIVPEGVIFQSGKAYKELRKTLVENYLYAVVSLPAGVFNPYSGVKTSILLMDKEISKKRNEILFIKIENDGYNLGAQRNPIKGSQLEEAVNILKQFKKEKFTESEIAHIVIKNVIAKNDDYNLSGERYKINNKLQITNFKLVEISKIAIEIKSGFACGSKDQTEDGIPHVRPMNITEHGILDWKNTKYITEEFFKKYLDYTLNQDDVLFNNTNSKELVGKTCLITENYKCGFSNHMTRIRAKKDLIVPKYLASILHYMWYKGIFLEKCNKWVGQAGINNKMLSEILIPLPPLSIQNDIVAEIEGYQKIIDGAKMVVENYKPKIDIDPDWEMVKLGDLVNLIGGGTPSKQVKEYWKNGNIDWITCSDFTNNTKYLTDSIRKITKLGLENSSANLIKAETLILVTRVSLGKLAFTIKPTAINQDLTALIIKSDIINKYFIYYYLMSISNKIEQDGNGITVKGINRNYVKRIKIPLPPIKIQKEIISKIEKEQELVNANKQLIEIFEQKIKDRIAKVWGE